MEVKIDADELCELRAAKKKLEDSKPFDWNTAGTVAGLQNRCINLEAENKRLKEEITRLGGVREQTASDLLDELIDLANRIMR